MKRSIDDLPIEILIEIIGCLSSYFDDYLSLRLVSSKWNYAISYHFKSIKHLIQRADWDLVTKDGLITRNRFSPLEKTISCMELLPNLKAVSVDITEYTSKDQNSLFNYLNTRPTITSLELVCGDGTRLQYDVKLENIQNFALNADKITFEDPISRFFQADHEFTQLYVTTFLYMEIFPKGEIFLRKRMSTLKRFSQQIAHFHFRFDDPIYIKQPGLTFENLESYSFYAYEAYFLKYVDNFVACCPNLKSIDCYLSDNALECPALNNFRAHTNVEDLVILGNNTSWKFVLKILEMFPMIKNLALKNIKGIGHNQISQALLKLPNLSLLYLRHLEEFLEDSLYKHIIIDEYSNNVNVYEDIVLVDCMALKNEYNSKYGRNLQIVRRNGSFKYREFPFKHGFNFMQNIFWPDSPPRLLTD